MKRVLLVGAGHAHAWLLAALAKEPVYGVRLTLVSPNARQIYSAMLPGVIAGHYKRAEAEFDVAMLAERAYAEFLPATVTAFDAEQRVATLSDGRKFTFDVASLNAGSTVANGVPGAREHAFPVKPFEDLIERVKRVGHIAIGGGGSAGTELAMALRHQGREVTVYSDRSIFPEELARRVERRLRRIGVDYRPGMRIDSIEPGPLVIAGAARQEFDIVLWATGPAPLPWLASSGLRLDEAGFVRVDRALRSTSHAYVFASGDCAALAEAKSGVHAVRHGMLLERNLRHAAAGTALEAYEPKPHALLIMSCGGRYAIAARGGWSAEGRLVWWWKNAIDRRWMRRLNSTGGR
ncbi:MAG TPA: FAD-dependent oxidoreductase [Burkholderiales bacterium]|nr:FAD-dependent oxidoreductase [Burkholderiales bacterium]